MSNLVEIGTEVPEKRTKMLKAYNDKNNLYEKSSGELIKQIYWPNWHTHKQTDKDRQTDTCTSINIHCCIQTPENIIIKDWLPVDFFVASIVLYHIPVWVSSSSKSQSYSLHLQMIQNISVIIINILIQKCIILWLITLTSVSDTSEPFIL